MPLTRIDLSESMVHSHGYLIADAVQTAAVECFNVTAEDRFQIVSAHSPQHMIISPKFRDVTHTSNSWCLVQITCNFGRDENKKRHFFNRVTELVSSISPIKPEDVIVNIIEVCAENWSFGITNSNT